MKIDFANLQYQYRLYKDEIDQRIQDILNKSNYIMGEEVYELESKLSEFTGARHAITCSSGTDALLLAMMALDIQLDDEVITTPFTFISTAETIAFLKAKPVFVDIEEDSFNIDATKIEAAITEKTKAIMPVSLFGQPADMEDINDIARKHNLKVIVDGAQSFGSTYKGKKDSVLGDIATTSFFPAKPFGCYGDGGAVFTNNNDYAEKIKMIRIHGQSKRYHHEYVGMGGRFDTIQAAILLAKLPHYTAEISKRQKIALQYSELLKDRVITPQIKSDRTSVWAQYSVRVKNRGELQAKLKERDVPSVVHYPIPLHLQECFRFLGGKSGDYVVAEKVSKEILSLPFNPFLSCEEVEYISESVKAGSAIYR
ncbi:DegT/DnrJ/EryC1/StrS aminotransferase family protein [Pseudoalteromonas sp.]|uniref:DegT/DnrJ/EryC1/StrS family aminotransferase n=1 Tax=Pseudoalteromonas sp. TaxID=53249 RepID=UPI002617C9E1|nr:DegT/DnrJ/EryC1/StrS family aminotransferase [Pseudoalteromonas sp.]MCP4588767.1 DegT/DnrJ/EryC1/StrS family aminotransferase [Pseudoalteromonas sp.]